ARVGEPWGPALLRVGGHARWRPLLGREIIGTELVWAEWVSSDPTPCWLRLDLAPRDEHPPSDPGSVWISVGRWEHDRFTFAADDVTVIFDAAEAARTRIMTGPRSLASSTPHDKSGPALTAEQWARLRRRFRFGERLRGRVKAVPHPGAIGVFVDVDLPVGGFVYVLLLSFDVHKWPSVGMETDFEVWWVDD